MHPAFYNSLFVAFIQLSRILTEGIRPMKNGAENVKA